MFRSLPPSLHEILPLPSVDSLSAGSRRRRAQSPRRSAGHPPLLAPVDLAGASQTGALGQGIIIGLASLVFTLLGMSVIDHFGRRKLLITGGIGLAVCLGAVATAFWVISRNAGGCPSTLVGWSVLASLMGFLAVFSFSNGVVIWVFISEVFPNRVRARGQALGSLVHWFWCAAINLVFPSAAEVSKSAPFVFFAAMMLLQAALVWRFLPETKGVSLEEMQRHLQIE